MSVTCKWILGVFGGLYLVALALLLVGTFGFLGQEKDPLSGVFLMPLGLPWNTFTGVPDWVLPWLAILAPLLNLILLRALCGAFYRRRSP